MPLYEYECEACSRRFEVIQKYSEYAETCVACGKGPVRRLPSTPAIQFKGSGWYITDYAQKGRSGQESAAADKGESKQAEKSDVKTTDAQTTDGGSTAAATQSDASPTPTKP